ncbi:hypothetical protein L6452_38868 [Arctium lappa]|uniref:Uncharacterized protein n=1 Tax=Arctium lappa TaxID=4217 RepID=A0ACB8XRW9_ARCLA|nr:hypothetical protein L6452_38868 [Arctium lappa]
MRGEGFEPDEMTLVSVLGACGELGDLSSGRLIECYVVDNEMMMNSYIGSTLIGMYAKCGDLVSARRIFDEMSKKDLVTWKLECYVYGAKTRRVHIRVSLGSNKLQQERFSEQISDVVKRSRNTKVR